MSDDFKVKEERIERLKLDNEEADQDLSLAQKKALIAEAKKRYGRNWKKILGVAGKLRVNKEAMLDMHGLGIGGDRIRDLNDPRTYKRR